jgi:hypothetical protein
MTVQAPHSPAAQPGKDQLLAQHIHQGHIGGDINLFKFTIYG